MMENYISLAETELWTAEIGLDSPLDPARVQDIVTDYVTESGITVVGFYAPDRRLFSMHRWPETREETHEATPSVQKCAQAMTELAIRFGANNPREHVLSPGQMQVMMGRKMGGYGSGKEVGIEALHSPNWEVIDGYMISARTLLNGEVEPYGEGAGRIRAKRTLANIAAIGELANRIEQHHFGLEGERPGITVMYEGEHIPKEMPMLEIDPAIIDAQIASMLETGTASMLIGNLYLNLPGGLIRNMVNNNGQLEEPVAKLDPENPQRDNLHSPRTYEVTWRTFFGDLDRALAETGTDHEALERAKNGGQYGVPTSDMLEAYHRALLPIYKYLRMLGYSHYDLRR